MFNSWFHIRATAQYLSSVLRETRIRSCYTHHKNELVIAIDHCEQLRGLRLLFENPLPYLQIETEHRKPRHLVPLFKTLYGIRIDQVLWHRSDRQILIAFQNNRGCLLLELFGINGNVYILDEHYKVISSFQKIKKIPGFDPDDFTDNDHLTIPETEFQSALSTHREKAITSLFPLFPIPVFSKLLIREILYRAGIAENTLTANLSDQQQATLYRELNQAFREIDGGHYYIYSSEPPNFSLLPLGHRETEKRREFDSPAEATQAYISTFLRQDQKEQLRRQLQSRLNLTLAQLQRKHSRQQRDLKQLPTATQFRQWADILLANIRSVPPHREHVDLATPENTSRMLRIPLNPKLSAAENANRYYEKSRQIDRSRNELRDSLDKTAASIQNIRTLLQQIDTCETLKSLRTIRKQIPEHLLQQAAVQATGERKPYHHFVIANHDILVGRSAKDNDELSFKHARPEDFWFHVEHGPGSHVLVRNPDKRESLSNEMIEVAAGIAAFYSKAKHSAVVPVIHTKKKYIRKRKNMPPGQVFTQFTKSVIVKPLDPRRMS